MKSLNKFTPTESPLERVEKAFFSDKAASAHVIKPTLTPQQISTVDTKKYKVAPKSNEFGSLLLVPIIFITSVLVAVIAILLVDHQIYLLPRSEMISSAKQLPIERVIVTPQQIKSARQKGRVVITVPALTTTIVVFELKEDINLVNENLILPVYTDQPAVSSSLLVRDTAYQSNKFLPIDLPVYSLTEPKDPSGVSFDVLQEESPVNLHKINQIKVEIHNPLSESATVFIDNSRALTAKLN